MLNTVICGAAGRMGKENTIVFNSDIETQIVGAIEVKESKYIGQDVGIVAGIENIGVEIYSAIEDVMEKADVVVDFTTPEATLQHIKIVRSYKKPIVIGTTGFNSEQINLIKEYSMYIPVFLSPNMSQGVNVLYHLVRKAAELLGDQFEVEIAEIHHDQKKDAPSGTAMQIGRIIAEVRGKSLDQVGVFGRHGIIGKRKKDEIGISSIRLSDVVGDHFIMFGGVGERIELVHKSSSRKTYARGALRAAKFITQKEKGFFTMNDVLGVE